MTPLPLERFQKFIRFGTVTRPLHIINSYISFINYYGHQLLIYGCWFNSKHEIHGEPCTSSHNITMSHFITSMHIIKSSFNSQCIKYPILCLQLRGCGTYLGYLVSNSPQSQHRHLPHNQIYLSTTHFKSTRNIAVTLFSSLLFLKINSD